VRVAERRGEPCLAVEALGAHDRPELRRKDLDHDTPAEPGLFGKEHAAHAAASELAFDAEPAA
jgi:hypothetical protein